jgi:hypothetical protein
MDYYGYQISAVLHLTSILFSAVLGFTYARCLVVYRRKKLVASVSINPIIQSKPRFTNHSYT